VANPTEDALVHALNEVTRLLEKRRSGRHSLRASEMRRALEKALAAVEGMREDDALIDRLVPTTGDNEYLELSKFEDRFVPQENVALKGAGLTKDAKVLLVTRIRSHRSQFRIPTDDYRGVLRDDLSKIREQLEHMLRDTVDRKHVVEKGWQRVFDLASGAVLVSVNSTISVSNPMASALSAAFGSALVGKALS